MYAKVHFHGTVINCNCCLCLLTVIINFGVWFRILLFGVSTRLSCGLKVISFFSCFVCADSACKLQEVFAEEAVASAGGEVGNGAGGEWPSSDSEDDDYNPEGLEKHPNSGSEAESKANSEGSDSSDSGSYSGGIAASSDASSGEDPEKLGLVAGQRKSKWKKADAGRSGNSSGSEDSETSLVDEFKTEGVQSSLGLGQRGSLAEESASDEEAMMIAGKRHRKAVDYKKLHDVSSCCSSITLYIRAHCNNSIQLNLSLYNFLINETSR